MKVIYLDLSTDPDEGHPITGIGAVCRGILWRREIDPDDDDRERAAIIALFGLFKHLAGVDEGRSEVICLVAHCGRTFDFIHLPRRMDMLGVKPPNLNIFLFDSRLLANKKGFVEKSRGKLKFLVRHFLGRRQTHDALQDAIDLRFT